MERIRNVIISGLFLIFIGAMAIVLRADEQLLKMMAVSISKSMEIGDKVLVKTATSKDEVITIEYIAADILEKLPFKSNLVELSGTVMKEAGVRSYYNNMNGINITRNGYDVGSYSQTSTDYEVEQMISFKKYLDSKGIQLLYVNEPSKYIDDRFYQDEFGGESYINRNADLFLSRIEAADIEYIDLRENIVVEKKDPLSLFYRTDHHWTVPASKWAAEIIAERLNKSYGYEIDLDLYDDKKFNIVEYKNAWLGEQGKKIAKSYIGLDNYTMMEPLYKTSYTITDESGMIEGDFDLFIDKGVYDMEADPYKSSSWHYSYKDYLEDCVHNNNAPYGNILVLGDSYEASMIPFLSLGIQEICTVVPRDIGEQSIRSIVEKGDYDTVIIAYAPFMIGAHDNASSSNYRMFTLD